VVSTSFNRGVVAFSKGCGHFINVALQLPNAARDTTVPQTVLWHLNTPLQGKVTPLYEKDDLFN